MDTEGGYVGIVTSAPSPASRGCNKRHRNRRIAYVRVTEDGTAGGCKYIQKPPNSGLNHAMLKRAEEVVGVYTAIVKLMF
jgi:hypothetical protein